MRRISKVSPENHGLVLAVLTGNGEGPKATSRLLRQEAAFWQRYGPQSGDLAVLAITYLPNVPLLREELIHRREGLQPTTNTRRLEGAICREVGRRFGFSPDEANDLVRALSDRWNFQSP